MTGSLERSLDRIGACGVLPVVEIPDGTDPIALVDALLGARIDAIEITLRTRGAMDAIRAIRTSRPDVLVAAGTVLTTDQVDAAVGAGAGLIVSPGFSERVVDHALEHGVDILPGVSTPTEVEIGLARGLPTGGIDAATLPGYLELANVLACGGSWLVGRRLLENGDMETVRRLAQEARIIVNRVRPRAGASPTAPAY